MTSQFDRLGGEEFFQRLVAGFYSRVASDPVLRPMYPDDLEAAERRLRLFLMQYFGGPATYDQERGHPRLRLRHAAFFIDQRARDIWLGHMLSALEEALAAPDVSLLKQDEQELKRYLIDTSQFLVNHGGLSILGHRSPT